MLDPRELILIGIRWSHAAAAAALVGGSAFFLLVLAPALRLDDPGATPSTDSVQGLVRKRAEAGFKELVDLSLVVFVISGGLLTFERLSSGAVGSAYVVVLGIKVLLSVLLYRWAVQVRRGRGWASPEARLLVGVGFLVVLLAAVLKSLYEGGLRS